MAVLIKSDLGWVQYQLSVDLAMEVEQWEIWWAVFEDSNEDEACAKMMLEELGDCPVALSKFAQSLQSRRLNQPKSQLEYRFSLVVASSMIGFLGGVLLVLVTRLVVGL